MRAILWPKQKIWRLFLFCLLSMMAALTIAAGAEFEPAPPQRDFWVWDAHTAPGGFRPAHATLRASGHGTLIYVEDSLWGVNVPAGFLSRLQYWLEDFSPAGAFSPGVGILALEQNLFGPLPNRFQRDDHRLIVLFANLGPVKSAKLDGFFNPFDQIPDVDAWLNFRQHSNEANLIYLNGFRQSEEYTTGVLAHELQRLLASAGPSSSREPWLAETLATGAMLVSGIFDGQNHVTEFVRATQAYPLVSPAPKQFGPLVLFSSFLLDSLPSVPQTALGALTQSDYGDRTAVEKLYLDQTGLALSFDAIFSNFVSYVFAQNNGSALLPRGWPHARGIVVPNIHPYYTFPGNSGEFAGSLSPYSFLAIDLASALSPSAVLKLEKIPSGPAGTCSSDASVLWKPISSTRIAIYSVGCNPSERAEKVQFRLKILDHPSLLPASPLRILP